jgi:hypothetical protein
MDSNEIVAWLILDQTLEKYPHLGPLKSDQSHLQQNFAQQIKRYFECQEKCQLIEYKIPLASTETEEKIKNLSFAFGEESELTKHRRNDWSSLYYDVKLKSDSLVREVRESIGLDRLRITKPTEEIEEELLDRVTDLVIEDDKNNPGKSLITFPLGGENRKIITEITGEMIASSAQKAAPSLIKAGARSK